MLSRRKSQGCVECVPVASVTCAEVHHRGLPISAVRALPCLRRLNFHLEGIALKRTLSVQASVAAGVVASARQ